MCESHDNVDSDKNANHEKGYTYLGSDPVGQNLGRVRDEQATEPQVVEDVVDEDEDNDRLARALAPRLGVAGRPDRLDDERDQHADARGEEERATAELVDEEADADAGHELHDRQVPVDLQLRLAVRDADGGQDARQVVAHEGVSAPLLFLG